MSKGDYKSWLGAKAALRKGLVQYVQCSSQNEKDLDISPSTAHNIFKRFKESEEISVYEGQQHRPKMNNRNVQPASRTVIFV